jgi:hypothetical protein
MLVPVVTSPEPQAPASSTPSSQLEPGELLIVNPHPTTTKRKVKTKRGTRAKKNKSSTSTPMVEDPSLDFCKYCQKHLGHLIYDCPKLIRKGKAPEKRAKPIIQTREERLKQVPCKFFQDGRCQKGEDCEFNHEVAQERKLDLCKYFLANKCDKGAACLYSHDPSAFPCRFNFTVGCSRTDCPFSHDTLTGATASWLTTDIESLARAQQETLRSSGDLSRAKSTDYTDLPSVVEYPASSDVSVELPKQGAESQPLEDIERSKAISAQLLKATKVPNLFDSDSEESADDDAVSTSTLLHRSVVRAGPGYAASKPADAMFDSQHMAQLLRLSGGSRGKSTEQGADKPAGHDGSA